MKLSILIPTIHERRSCFNAIYDELFAQQQRLKERREIEIIALLDTRQRSIGRKRNDLKRVAQGEYIAFVDDDDEVSGDYLPEIIDAINHKPDIVLFNSMVTINGGHPLLCMFDPMFEKDANFPTHYERIPNHLCPVRAAIAPDYPDLSFGEDSLYAVALKPRISSFVTINKTLYFYRYSSITSRSFRSH